jgi:hypothetical protein
MKYAELIDSDTVILNYAYDEIGDHGYSGKIMRISKI